MNTFVSDQEKKVFEFVNKGDGVTVSQVVAKTGVHDFTARKSLYRLVEQKKLKRMKSNGSGMKVYFYYPVNYVIGRTSFEDADRIYAAQRAVELMTDVA